MWVVAGGGQEPVFEHGGRRWQYMWNMKTGEHAYYCFDDDLFYRSYETREVI